MNIDIISADEPLDGYKLVVAPSLLILNDKRIAQMKEFVTDGGCLVLTLRCGMKDDFNSLLPSRQPGALAGLAGLEVEDFYALHDPIPVVGDTFKGSSRLWAERLKLIDGNLSVPIARYGACNGWLDDQVAVAVHHYGKGMVFYIGAYLDESSQQTLIDHILLTAGIPFIQTPNGIEVRTRIRSNGEELFFVLNHTRAEQTFSWPWSGVELLSGQVRTGEVKLATYGVAILRKNAGDNPA